MFKIYYDRQYQFKAFFAVYQGCSTRAQFVFRDRPDPKQKIEICGSLGVIHPAIFNPFCLTRLLDRGAFFD